MKSARRRRALPLLAAHGVAWSLLLAFALLVSVPAHAQVFAEELRTKGLAPDLQVQGGVGFGLGHSLDNNFLGRARFGLLYAYEPWIVNLGPVLELGGLAGLGGGGEIEINSFGGAFGQIAFSRVQHEAWMTHLALGFTIFGLEWQHRFESSRDYDALLFDVRAPLGIWWFLTHDEDQKEKRAKAKAAKAAGEMRFIGGQPAPEQANAQQAATAKGPSEDDRFRAEKDIERAREERAKGNHALAAEALLHAYQLDPDPMVLLLLSDAELAAGGMVSAAHDLKRFLDTASSPEAKEKVPETQAKLEALQRRIPQLRVAFDPAPDSPSELR
ncbi:MAG TPA: hypothetical protein VHM19_16160, partial [Polyangiales bacterium]|nr:hypothetical protein [Polyangiales bacterium]